MWHWLHTLFAPWCLALNMEWYWVGSVTPASHATVLLAPEWQVIQVCGQLYWVWLGFTALV